jgi:lysophospholipase L1-like esterase
VETRAAANLPARPLPGTHGAHEAGDSKLPQLPAGTKLLHVGDSFAGALGHELNRLLKSHNVHGTLKYEKATYIPTWASNRDFAAHLARYQPDLVLITLGGNELKIPDPNARAETVRRVVKRVEGRPCVWVGIPLWEGADPALMGVIRENVAPCLYLDSTALLPNLARARDGIHPSTSARTQWAEAVVLWLRNQLAPDARGWEWKPAKD